MNLTHISRLLEILAKNIFDNQLCLNTQYHSLKLQRHIIESQFIAKRMVENREDIQKLLLSKVLRKMILKLKQIKEKLAEIHEYLRTHPNKVSDNGYHEKGKLYFSSLPSWGPKDDEWLDKRLDFIEKDNLNLDWHLFPQSVYMYTLTIYEDDDDLVVNSVVITFSTISDFLKELKESIFPALLESIKIIINYTSNAYQNIQGQQSMQQRPQQTKLSEDDVMNLGKFFKYGLQCLERLQNLEKMQAERQAQNAQQHSQGSTTTTSSSSTSEQASSSKAASDDKDRLQNFLNIFLHLPDKKGLNDILELNFDSFLRMLLIITKNWSENLLAAFFGHFLCSQQHNCKIFAEVLTKNLLLRIENTPEELHEFHPFYEFKDNYHFLIHKLIKWPFRSLNRFADDQFIEKIFKQIILIFIKKTRKQQLFVH